MTRQEFFCQCFDVIEHWVNGNRKHLREVTDKLYNEVTKPHWISVEDELPPKKSEYDDLSNKVLATDGKEIYESVYNHDFEDWFTHDMWGLDNITHWCYLPQLPVLSNSEKIGKLIDANNMIDHFADASKKVKKGDEE